MTTTPSQRLIPCTCDLCVKRARAERVPLVPAETAKANAPEAPVRLVPRLKTAAVPWGGMAPPMAAAS